MKYPIGIQTFSSLREEGYLYIDKTAYIKELVDNGKYYFLSRPRRFGKSLLLSTIEAYFKGQKELFEGLAIAETETEWIEHPVVRIDFASIETTSADGVRQGLRYCLQMIADDNNISIPEYVNTPSLMLQHIITNLRKTTGRKVVVLIDEYDKGIIETLRDEDENRKALDTLRPLFSVLKSHDEHIRFAFITGVSRFRNTTIFSGFNNPTDISLDDDYAEILGISKEEINKHFQTGIEKVAQTNDLTIEKAREELRCKYDGYRFTARDTHVYNPFSLMQAMSSGRLNSYWVMSGTSRILADYLRESDFRLEDLTSRWVSEIELGSTYSKENPISLFFQTGYLTIDDFRRVNNTYRLCIPNQEVQSALVDLLIPEFVEAKSKSLIPSLNRDLAYAIAEGNVDDMMSILRSIVSSVPYHEIETKVLERHIHLCMYIIFMMLGVCTHCEHATAAGRVDMVAETPWRVYVMEFKLDSTPQAAMEQIDSTGYAIPWEARGRQVTKIGVNFSSALRTIENWIFC